MKGTHVGSFLAVELDLISPKTTQAQTRMNILLLRQPSGRYIGAIRMPIKGVF